MGRKLPPLLNCDMVGARLGVTRSSVYNYVYRELLKPALGPPYIFTDDEVDRFIREVWPLLRPAGGIKAGSRRAGGKRRRG